MNSSCSSPSGNPLAVLVHDLRQPLGNIALSVSFIDMLLDGGDPRIGEQIKLIQQQIDRASAMLERAMQSQRARAQMEAASNLALTSAHTPAGA